MFKVSFEDYIKTLIGLLNKRDTYTARARQATNEIDRTTWNSLATGVDTELDDLMDLFGYYFEPEQLTVDYLTSHLNEMVQQGQGESPSFFIRPNFHTLKC